MFVLVGTVAIILFNCIAFFITKNSLEEKITVEKQGNIYQMMSTIEQKLQNLDYTLNSYTRGSSFERIIQHELTAKQFDVYQSINKQLNYISSFGPNQTTAELVSLEGNWVIDKNGLKQLTRSLREEIKSDYLSLPNASTWLKKDSKDKTVKLVKQLPLFKTNKYGVLIVNFPIESLSNLIYQQAQSSPISIYNKDGNLIYQSKEASDSGARNEVVTNLINIGNLRTGVEQVEGKNGTYKVAYSKSSYNGWIYFTEINKTDLAGAMKPTVLGIVFMSLFMLTLTFITAYLYSDYFSKPIRDLLQYIPKNKSNYKDEFELIGQSVREVIDRNEVLNAIVTNQAENLKTLFMLNLFHGRITDNEVEEKIQSFCYPATWGSLYVWAIQIDDLDHSKFTRKDEDVLMFGINRIVDEVIPKDNQFTPTVLDSNLLCTIFICEEEDWDHHLKFINQYTEKIQKQVMEKFNLSISVGISRPFKQLTESVYALEQGIDALKYRLKVGKGSIIFYDSIAAIFNNQIRTSFPKKLENELFDHIKKGESKEAIEVLHIILIELFKSQNPHELEINIMRFINDLMGFMQILGMETMKLGNHKSLYDAVSKMRTAEGIEMFVKNKIIYPIIQTINERTNSQYKTISEEIVHIIQKEFDTDISLEKIANRLHYNPSYLSSIFKKEFNQSFSEYLTLYRYNMAKKWLIETNTSVREIAERLQYNNSQNFIRSFRKIEGTTPGKYREQHRHDLVNF
ncbi:AraC family transcriptional regulator [Ferdinandcohnia quinoae]|uniref:Helix-turn-helix domain-containing protein n=1 Tax=Fredinandcohnia quinoae TaxID=2918902 RepID=A0AAW5E650_9BACI|nr:helix-turn-helix domain-containing protein [Fredinandcohnia sp. SECRCQ15]MCH1625461.1 helix-turn-helix domain-containing protein [Fredinandcohnia sp. SECRCQ15]